MSDGAGAYRGAAGRPVGWRLPIKVVLVVAAVIFLFWSSDTVYKCEATGKNTEHYQALHKSASYLARSYARLALNMKCAGGADDVWVALSGIAVALFTFTLWRSTERLWVEARDQREATLRTEAPNLFIYGLDRITKEEDNFHDVVYIIRYKVANVGRAPAIIKEVRAGAQCKSPVGWTVPDAAPTWHPLLIASVIQRNETVVVDMRFPNEKIGLLDEYDESGGGTRPDYYSPDGRLTVGVRVQIDYVGATSGDATYDALWVFDNRHKVWVPSKAIDDGQTT